MKKKFIIAQSKRGRTKTTVLERVVSMDTYELFVGAIPGSKTLMFGAFDAQAGKQVGFALSFEKARE